MKIIYTILLSLWVTACYAQTNLAQMKGFWQNKQEQSIIEYFSENVQLTFLYSNQKRAFVGSNHANIIGFYDSCEVPYVDSLKDQGAFYFEVSNADINDAGKIEQPLRCLELQIFEEGKETLMNIYDSSHQQFATYKKLSELPKKLEEYLHREHPDVYEDYQRMLHLANE